MASPRWIRVAVGVLGEAAGCLCGSVVFARLRLLDAYSTETGAASTSAQDRFPKLSARFPKNGRTQRFLPPSLSLFEPTTRRFIFGKGRDQVMYDP